MSESNVPIILAMTVLALIAVTIITADTSAKSTQTSLGQHSGLEKADMKFIEACISLAEQAKGH
jgi:hypothetical protein